MSAMLRRIGATGFSLRRGFSSAKADYDVVIVGGGCGGIGAASQLLMKDRGLKIAIVEPSDEHYYQPGWTLAGANLLPMKSTVDRMSNVMPKKVTWVKQKCETFDPENNKVVTDGGELTYGMLLVTPGIKLHFDRVKGLIPTLGKNGVCSNYSFTTAPFTKQFAESTKKGTFIFTSPATPIKCGGAPLKAAYLIDDLSRRLGNRDSQNFKFCAGGIACFGVPYYRGPLEELLAERGIENIVSHNLVEVRGEEQIAVFQTGPESQTEMKFDFLHVVPPQGPHDFMAKSPLADASGFCEVDKGTTQHVKYPNVFGIGDASNMPASKTAAATVSQATVASSNMLDFRAGRAFSKSYNGYAGCPIVVSNKLCIMAEFGYDGVPMESLKFMDQRKPSRLWFHMKRDAFPTMYWWGILTGLWRGPSMIPEIPAVYNAGKASALRA